MKDKKLFWDNKITRWEDAKYADAPMPLGLLLDVNRSVKTRLALAHRAICPLIKDRTIIELGCASARLMPEFLKAGAKKYIGVDISSEAISHARERARETAAEDRCELIVGDGNTLPKQNVDICLSLGLLDWLSPQEIKETLSRIDARYYLHSYSRKSFSIQQMLHRLYVFCMYGHSDASYIPRYYTQEAISDILKKVYGGTPAHYKSSDLSFSTLAYRLPSDTPWHNE